MSQGPAKKFPLNAKDYELYEEVGEGVSATVYRALCIPLNEVVAIKVLDLEKCNNDLDGIRREVQTMILIDHPNLLRAHCSFTAVHNLWVVMPYMAGGSCLHIIKTSYSEGFEEPVIATLLRETLKALVYLHNHGHIHRDVKAGNILLDSNGAVKLGDYGVSACMYDTGDRQRTRNTFVGTPCWMAPEVMQQLHGYDFKADIWSFGITALELAHGHAPFSKYPPMKVLLMTLQNAPPGLDYERDKKFSKAFRDMVSACLVKDPKKRPSSEKLLKHPFFKHARSIEYLERGILAGMPPLGERFRMLKAKEADMLVQNKALYEDKEQLSQQEYIRGISAWNFNLDDLKTQASLIPDDFTSNSEEASVSGTHAEDASVSGAHAEDASVSGTQAEDASVSGTQAEDASVSGTQAEDASVSGQEGLSLEKNNDSKAPSHLEDVLSDLPIMEDSLAAFPMKPLLALKGCFDVCEDDIAVGSPTSRDSVPSDSEQQNQPQTSVVDREAGTNDIGDSSHSSLAGRRKFSSGSLLQEYVLSPKKHMANGDREHLQSRYQVERNYSGPLQHRHKKDFTNAGEDASEGAVVERRGRFKVTSADVSPKGQPNLLSLISCGATSPTIPNHSVAAVLPPLQFILQQNTAQRDEILKLIKILEQPSGNGAELTETGTGTISPINPTAKERELQSQIIQLQQSIGSMVEEIQRVKAKNTQLERKLNAVLKQDDKIR